MDRIRIGLVGIGKIARDQHLPALAALPDFELAATASRHGRVDGVRGYSSIAEMLAGEPEITAVSLCTPPEGRFEQAVTAIRAGKHLMLEKPPTATVSEAEALAALAREQGVTLFATWHSREAAEVDAARDWLADKRIGAVRIRWMENIRQWHPGQDWILAPGGFGVFDPGINALSIATRILPQPLTVLSATMDVPANRACPIASAIRFRSGDAEVDAQFDFLQTGLQTWHIEVETDGGLLRLTDGGCKLELPGREPISGPNEEYPRLYAGFAKLVRDGRSDVDLRPIQLVADAFLVADRRTTEAFEF
ncbi:Gfo/Idh/MocA family oxidoreductase [Sphingomonas sp. BT-65]|uniref:Gfo/Idh/MocA family protein n=1 Tax=Sphingomonas sp. BT-65 TaxID=2989821 RepID=UPI002235DC9F|nr:Gfo/Idh/MocA family oxidoreductase [Sphingomonas sp. BT-65]MCW4463840.1 Gfo/Idh/MocA family oxidoreductase [Sphingomonas sp. BT-65]